MKRFEIINSVPNIEEKSYLEIGTGAGLTFLKIKARNKIGIDIQPYDFALTTSSDKYFDGHPRKFDIIFIDADHRCESVLRDFNNSILHLNPRGIIFVHDLFPPNRQHIVPSLCGDGFKILLLLLDDNTEFFCFKEDFGFTLFLQPQVISLEKFQLYKNKTYDDLMENKSRMNFVSGLEMVRILKENFSVEAK